MFDGKVNSLSVFSYAFNVPCPVCAAHCSGFQLYSSRILCFIVARTQVVVSNVTLRCCFFFLPFFLLLSLFFYRMLLENARIRLRRDFCAKSRGSRGFAFFYYKLFDISLSLHPPIRPIFCYCCMSCKIV